MNAHAAKSINQWLTYAPPTKGFIEEVYLFEPLANENGHSMALLTNPEGTAATSVAWSTKELRYLTVWKNTADERDGYVMWGSSRQPATYNRSVGTPLRSSAETAPRNFHLHLQLGIHTDAESIAAQKIITRLQGSIFER